MAELDLVARGKALLGTDTPERGVELFREAAAQGAGEACALLALFSALGVLQPRDMNVALDQLTQAAARGWAPAQRELQLLARDESADWQALRNKIDSAALGSPPPPRIVSETPLVFVMEALASQAECAWLIERGQASLRRAAVYKGSAQEKLDSVRTNSEADYTVFNAGVLLSVIRDRIATAIAQPVSHFEVAKLLHYTPGQHFGLHSDFLELKTPELVREIERRGQRQFTALIYLNDDYEGGETHFPRLDFSFKGRTGDSLAFRNVDAAGAPDYATLHAGQPPTSGEKWLFSQWVRTKPVAP